MSDLASVRVIVCGHVQGVFFRAFAARHAKELGVNGYVRNLPSGDAVELQAEGEREKLKKLVEFLNAGPPGAGVDKVEISWSEYIGQFARFSVRY